MKGEKEEISLFEQIKEMKTRILDLRISELLNPQIVEQLHDLRRGISDILDIIKPGKRPLVWTDNQNG